MIIIRHNCLLPPYNDYTALSVDMLDDLACDVVSPNIDELPATIKWGEEIFDYFIKAENFYCSEALRTRSTGELLMQRFGISKNIMEDKSLNEIYFVPSKLISSASENPLEAVRKKLYQSILNGKEGVENIKKLTDRAESILKEHSGTNCVLFSHGFFMRFFDSYCSNGKNAQRALENIQESLFVDYLEVRMYL